MRYNPIDGFTLFELLAVMAVMLLVLGLSLGAFLDWGRATDVETTGGVLESKLSLARQWAVTHREPVAFTWEAHHYTVAWTNGLLGATNRLPAGLALETGEVNHVIFRPSGRCDRSPTNWPSAGLTREIWLREDRGSTNDLAVAIRVSAMTGLARMATLTNRTATVEEASP